MIDQFLPSIDEVRADGAVVLLKWDGERSSNRCTWSLRKSRLTTCGARIPMTWGSRYGLRWQIIGLRRRYSFGRHGP